jgi:TolB-like protein/Tfp pilus assembly protein PilF
MATLVRFDCFEVDLAAGQLLKRGVKVPLREQSFQALASLLEHPGEVATREDLRRRLWPDDVFVDFDNNLNTAIARLREVLGDSAEHPRFIETLPRHGYRFIGTVSEPIPAPGRAGAPRTRLLVLPFVNSSGDLAQEYFSDAVTDEIITELAGLAPGRLAVIARTTAMRYKGTTKAIAQIGRELNVDYVVEGTARRADEHVQLTVQLIQTGDQAHLFAKRYDAPVRDLFATEREAAQTLAEQLQVLPAAETGGPGVGRPRREPTRDPLAYNSYIQGRYDLDRATPDDIAKAKHLFEDAVRRDPHFALAHYGLADVCFFLGFNGLAAPRDVFSMGLFHALRAVEIDNTLAETQALLALFRLNLHYDWAEVERLMCRAIELDPASPVVRVRHALGLQGPGRLDEAIAELERALELDPLSVFARTWLAISLWLRRQTSRAIDEARVIIELDPTYPSGPLVMGIALCVERRFDEAIVAIRKAVELFGGAPMALGWLGLALAMSDNGTEARALLERFRAMADQTYVAPSNFAWIHLGLGEIDEAFSRMDKAIDAGDPMMVPIKSYWFLDPLRDDPRFHALLRRMNLDPPSRDS